jgi:hypothetical protein
VIALVIKSASKMNPDNVPIRPACGPHARHQTGPTTIGAASAAVQRNLLWLHIVNRLAQTLDPILCNAIMDAPLAWGKYKKTTPGGRGELTFDRAT